MIIVYLYAAFCVYLVIGYAVSSGYSCWQMMCGRRLGLLGMLRLVFLWLPMFVTWIVGRGTAAGLID